MHHFDPVFKGLKELQTNETIKDHESSLVYLRQLMSILAFLVKIFVKEIETDDIFLVRHILITHFPNSLNQFIIIVFTMLMTNNLLQLPRQKLCLFNFYKDQTGLLIFLILGS